MKEAMVVRTMGVQMMLEKMTLAKTMQAEL
jgi:hypothetical protein